MKKTYTLTALLLTVAFCAHSQKRELDSKEYQRSSLHTVLIQSGTFPKAELVMNAYENSPFPEKYNDHRIKLNDLDLNKYILSEEEKEAFGLNKSEGGDLIESGASNLTAGIISDDSEVRYQIDKYIKDTKIANNLVSKWFSIDKQELEGYDPMGLIRDRGAYSASSKDIKVAGTETRGLGTVKNAGKDLIKNTFVVFTKMNFVSNEPPALLIKQFAYTKAEKVPAMLRDKAYKAADAIYEKTKEGYSVWTKAWLYQLNWDDSEFAKVSQYYVQRKGGENVNFSDLDFELEFIGMEKATSLVTFSLEESRTEEQILNLSTVRNIDKVYAKLQKEYDVFKTKTPIYVDGKLVSAKIGMKEGIEGGEKFEVLEELYDMETKTMSYKKTGTITVDDKNIWDNRYGAGEEGVIQEIDATYFKGGKKLSEGMLIRQIK